jgi:hypothetical protein
MKKIWLSAAFFGTMTLSSCEILTAVADTALSTPAGGTGVPALTNDEVISGLKEALTVGIKNGAGNASKLDGFLGNPLIRLPFPQDAIKMREWCMSKGMDKQVTDFETTLNRTAEEATKEAAPIFVKAITDMSIADGFAILKGADNAATNYLREKTTSQLITAFSPKVTTAIQTVNLTKYWEPLTKAYNATTMISGNAKVDTDLGKYITDRAITGLFSLVESEEKKIRKDPVARVSSILQKVFGSLDK